MQDAEKLLRDIAEAQQRLNKADLELSEAREELKESAVWKRAESARRMRRYAQNALSEMVYGEMVYGTLQILQPPLQGMPASGEGGVRSVTIGDMTLTAHLPIRAPVEQGPA